MKFRKLRYHQAMVSCRGILDYPHPGYNVRFARSGDFVADVFPMDDGGKEGGAYARLFVEAPAMLEILRGIVRGWGEVSRSDFRRALDLLERIDGSET